MSDITVTTQGGESIDITVQSSTSVEITSPASSSVSVTEKGPKGDTGATGPAGADGPAGPGFASGGTENQFIQKNSATDYDTKWSAYTLPAADGADGQVLTTNGAATVTFAYPKTIAEDVKNVSGGPLTKGTPVHVTGSVGNLAEVIAADAATNYPAHFVLNEDLADDQEGLGIAIGFINNVDVPDASIYTEGQTVYLGESGGWTTTKPTGANAIQNLGIIIKVNTSGNKISGIIMGAGRANDVPNIATGNIWAGNADGVATATDTAYIDIANSRVGIGTTTPAYPLDVNGNIRATAYRIGGATILSGSGSVVLGSAGATSTVSVYTIGGEKMRIDSSGRVGIGTTTPSTPLHVVGDKLLLERSGANDAYIESKTTNAGAYFTANSEGAANYYGLELKHGTTGKWFVGSYGTSGLEFVNGAKSTGTRSIFISSSNNVGIGTTSPSEKLHVSGSIRVDTGDRISMGGSGLSMFHSGTYAEIANYTGDFIIRNTAANEDIIFKAEAGTGSDVEVMRIDGSSGRVGIGTTSPAKELEVNGGIRIGANETIESNGGITVVVDVNNNETDRAFTVAQGSTANPLLTVKESGNVGIGTTSPASKLHVEGSAFINNGLLKIQDSSATNYYESDQMNSYGTYYDWKFAGSQVMRINSSGNVGIGTTSPVHTLDLKTNPAIGFYHSDGTYQGLIGNGSATVSGGGIYDIGFRANSGYNLLFAAGGSTERMRIDSSGNVGIGTASPTSKLDVVGLANINDGSNNVMISSGNTALTTGANNTAVGYQAALNNSTGEYNTAAGYFSMRNATSSVQFNTALGSSSARNVTGNANTAVGHEASFNGGAGNASLGWRAGYNAANYNVSVGYGAASNTTGNGNTVIGYNAAVGDATSNFSSTVAVGREALYSLTTGVENTAVGTNALRSATSASYNSAFGAGALQENSTSASNSAFGHGALRYNTGANNTAFGTAALRNKTSGDNNSAFGVNALYTNVTGSNNIAIGRNAGYYTTGSNNALIGYYAGYGGATSTFSNTVALGYQALYGLTTGANNTAVGMTSGFSNTDGSQNSFFGRNAGYYSTGSSNVVIGYEAGYGSATSAYSNTVAIGQQALHDLTTGDHNTAIGLNASDKITTGSYNVSLGNYALRLNQISSGNTALGYGAAYETTNGNNSVVGYLAGYYGNQHNAALGARALNYSTGSYNTAIGSAAAQGVYGSSTFSNTVAVGYEALTALTTGGNNTALGYQSLKAVNTGGWNTSLGYNSGLLLTTESYNTAIGVDAIGNTTGTEFTTGVGYRSLYDATGNYAAALGYRAGQSSGFGGVSVGSFAGQYATGSSNVLVGYAAGQGSSGVSTFGGTTAVGYQALQSSTNGGGNTAVGHQAGLNTDSGGSNVAIGWNAMLNNEGGYSNVAVGREALYNNISGGQNVAVGREAGYSSTGTGNVFIGYQAGYNETTHNKLYIANSNTTTPLIYGDFNLGEITINGDLNVSGGNLRADAVEINGRALTTPATGEYGAGSRLVTQFASGTVTAGKVYVANAGSWAEGDANAGSTSIGMIAVATDAASATEMLIEGVIKLSSNTGFSGAAAGTVLYLSTTAGELTTTAPSTAGEYVRVCGYVVNASTNEVFFSPSRDWTAL